MEAELVHQRIRHSWCEAAKVWHHQTDPSIPNPRELPLLVCPSWVPSGFSAYLTGRGASGSRNSRQSAGVLSRPLTLLSEHTIGQETGLPLQRASNADKPASLRRSARSGFYEMFREMFQLKYETFFPLGVPLPHGSQQRECRALA
jgi:hypothetical protein